MQLTWRAALLTGWAFGLGGLSPAAAQPARTPDAPPTATRERAESSAIVDAAALEAGANSFTEGQARSRLEEAGFTNLQDLRKDDAGFWRGRASRGGTATEVVMDFRGRIAAGPGVSNLGRAGTAPATERMGARDGSGAAHPDGAPGNPPSTATGRAVDRLQGEAVRPDGTPGNPPGTAAGRALDRATGTNATGTNPAAPGTTGGATTR